MYPVPSAKCWSLIARIGTGTPFYVGTSRLIVTGAGELYLGINIDNPSGNSGAWTVNIKIGGLPPTPVTLNGAWANGKRFAVDGNFGFLTYNVTRQFQVCAGLADDGIIGLLTWDETRPLRPAGWRRPAGSCPADRPAGATPPFG